MSSLLKTVLIFAPGLLLRSGQRFAIWLLLSFIGLAPLRLLLPDARFPIILLKLSACFSKGGLLSNNFQTLREIGKLLSLNVNGMIYC